MTTRNLVRLYSRPDCHLCDEAELLLADLGRLLDFTYERFDITSDPALEKRYGEAIPVIGWGEEELMRAPINSLDLRSALRTRLAHVS